MNEHPKKLAIRKSPPRSTKATRSRLEVDRQQIEAFVDALFRHAPDGRVPIRSFVESGPPFIHETACIKDGDLSDVVETAVAQADKCANANKGVVFAPVVGTFSGRKASEDALDAGLVISVEVDRGKIAEGVAKLEQILGSPTAEILSGGKTAEGEDKVHLHWRLSEPALKGDHEKLKVARRLATEIVGGDATSIPAVHPMRWPGSWHRKGEPRMCAIRRIAPDSEIKLDEALRRLSAAKPNGVASNVFVQFADSVLNVAPAADITDLVARLIEGKDLHETSTSLAASLVGSGMSETGAVRFLEGLFASSSAERDQRFRARFDDIPRLVASALGKFAEQKRPSTPIVATPWEWRDPKSIPMREWLYGHFLIRKHVSSTVAPGGVGKSTLGAAETVAQASGKKLLHDTPHGALRVWLWNGEDPLDDIDRSLLAACLHYGVRFEDVRERLFVDSGRQTTICVARQERNGVVVAVPVFDALVKQIRDNNIDVLKIDPFVSSHAVPENDNNGIDLVAKTYARIADVTGCAVELIHHTRKTNGAGAEVEDARGASALINAVRSARTLNPMNRIEAERIGLEDQCRSYFRINYGKTNLVRAPEKADWIHLEGVDLGNNPYGGPGDNVAVATAWEWPQDEIADPAELKEAEDIFLDMLRRFTEQGRYVSASEKAPNYAPKAFNKERGEITKNSFERAMVRLLNAKAIRVEQYGKPSNPHFHICKC